QQEYASLNATIDQAAAWNQVRLPQRAQIKIGTDEHVRAKIALGICDIYFDHRAARGRIEHGRDTGNLTAEYLSRNRVDLHLRRSSHPLPSNAPLRHVAESYESRKVDDLNQGRGRADE